MRLHRFSNSIKDLDKEIVDVSSYEDMQELIYASDVVISDYSSCIWDVSLTGKPCFIYATDLKKYKKDRDFYTPISEWPFPVAENMEELINNINIFDENTYRLDIVNHHKKLGSFENGKACEQIAQYMLKLL